ncbi:MAG: hypothetical protein A2Z01_04040 [Betaproteobacteria bacterium RBG_16_58_11]|nr:MAG: hypothetical protein A2Z01_04040 [Betaproteobacteria bacterium RBG_16_58_11]
MLVDWLAGRENIILATGRCCVQEVERNLAKKLPQAQAIWQKFLSASGLRIDACPRTPVTGINAKDRPIVAAAIAANAAYFVTDDKALIAEMRAAKIKTPQTVTPRKMLEELLALGLSLG